MGFLSSIGSALGAVEGLVGALTGGSSSRGASSAASGSGGSFTSPIQSVFSQFGQNGMGMSVLNELIDDGGDDTTAASSLSGLAGSLG
ncbi:MAG: hypothetical protein WCE44_01960 [Candidatus Velthaea sp.]|jgi:hypothetical protein